MCTFKTLDGWKSLKDSKYDSGFKGQAPFVEENVRFQVGDDGNGVFKCDGQTPPH